MIALSGQSYGLNGGRRWAGKKWEKRLQGPSFFKHRSHILHSSGLLEAPWVGAEVAYPHPHADQAMQKLSPQGILIHCEGCHAAVQTSEMVSEPVAEELV